MLDQNMQLVSVAQQVGLSHPWSRTLKPGPEVIKRFLCSTQLSTKFILLINVKVSTIVGVLTFISMINITSESLKVYVHGFEHFT